MRRGREFDGKLLLVVGLFDFYETLLGGAAVAIAWLSSRQIRRIGLSAFDASRVKCHAFDCQMVELLTEFLEVGLGSILEMDLFIFMKGRF